MLDAIERVGRRRSGRRRISRRAVRGELVVVETQILSSKPLSKDASEKEVREKKPWVLEHPTSNVFSVPTPEPDRIEIGGMEHHNEHVSDKHTHKLF